MAAGQGVSKLILLYLYAWISIQLFVPTSNWQALAGIYEDGDDTSGFVTFLERRPGRNLYEVLISTSKTEFAVLRWMLDEYQECMRLETAIIDAQEKATIYGDRGQILMEESIDFVNKTWLHRHEQRVQTILYNYYDLPSLRECSNPIPWIELPSNKPDFPAQCRRASEPFRVSKPQGEDKDIYCLNSCNRIQQIYSDTVKIKEDSNIAVLWRSSDGFICHTSTKITDKWRFIFGNKVVVVDSAGHLKFSSGLSEIDKKAKDSIFIRSSERLVSELMFCGDDR